MGFFSSLFSSPVATPQNALTVPWSNDGWEPVGSTYAGVNVTTSSALQLLTVYGCVQFIANGISTLPLDHLREGPDGPEEVPRRAAWLEQPTADLDSVAWRTQILTSLLLAGNAWCLIGRNGLNVTSLTPLDPMTVQPDRTNGRLRWNVNGTYLSTFEVLHIPGVMFPGADVGLSPIAAAKQTIGSGMAAEEYTGRFWGEDSTPPGVIETPGNLNPETAKQMARSWQRAHGGKSKRGLPGVLEGGAQWKPTAVTNEQAQFLQTRNLNRAQIASELFLIDPNELGIPIEGKSLTYTNTEQQAIRRVQVTYLPWIIRLERALTGLLPRPQYVKLNVNGLLRGDTKARYEAYAIGITNGFLTPNEARAFEEWQPLPDPPAPQEAP